MASGISIPETPEKDQESEASTSEAQSDPSSDAADPNLKPHSDGASTSNNSPGGSPVTSRAIGAEIDAKTTMEDQESEASTSKALDEPSSDAEREDITDKKEKETTAPEHKEDHGSKDPSQSMAEKMTALTGLISSNFPLKFWNKANIRIFSRSSESEYGWLVELLGSDLFGYQVRSHYITNNGYRQFAEAVSECSFGILYHSKNRGRVNVTDVTDSLYDEELAHLHAKLGKQRVIVLIDDLEDSRDQEKVQILNNQPSIGELAQELFLINLEEKTSDYKLHLKSEQSWSGIFSTIASPVIQLGSGIRSKLPSCPKIQFAWPGRSSNSTSESEKSQPPAPLPLEPSSQGSLESHTDSEED